jgi:hypothetical protein
MQLIALTAVVSGHQVEIQVMAMVTPEILVEILTVPQTVTLGHQLHQIHLVIGSLLSQETVAAQAQLIQ